MTVEGNTVKAKELGNLCKKKGKTFFKAVKTWATIVMKKLGRAFIGKAEIGSAAVSREYKAASSTTLELNIFILLIMVCLSGKMWERKIKTIVSYRYR